MRPAKAPPTTTPPPCKSLPGVLAGVIWAIRNPELGVIEPDDIDHETMIAVAQPYLGEIIGSYGQWTPLENRNWPFEEDIDPDDPFQFKNIRVN